MTRHHIAWGALVAASVMIGGCYGSLVLDSGDEDGAADTIAPDTWTYDTYDDTLGDLPPDPPPDPIWDPYVEPDVTPEPIRDTYVEPDVTPDPIRDTYHDTWWDVPPDPPPDPIRDTYVEPDLPPPGELGDACTSDWHCGGVPSPSRYCAESILGMLSFPGGYCTAACSSDDECGAAGRCVDVMLEQLCLRLCTDPDECRTAEGYDCMELPFFGGGPYCLPSGD